MQKISIIVAIDENGAIGKNNDLLTYIPADLKRFKALTTGHSIIMGRKTFESLPKGALPNRRNIVITHQKDLQFQGCEMAASIDEAISLCANESEIFIIGGASIYSQALKFANNLYITHIHHCFNEADVFFPTLQFSDWKVDEKVDITDDEKVPFNYSFVNYSR